MMMDRRQDQPKRTLGAGPVPQAREAYGTALASYRQAQERANGLARQLHDVASIIDEQPLRLAPKHPDASAAGVPLHVMTGPFRSDVDMSAWPSAGDLLDALGALHRTHARALSMYQWLLPTDRAAVEAP